MSTANGAPAPEAAAEARRGPEHIQVMAVFVTNRCNLACTNCCAHTVRGKAGARDLSWPDFKAAIDTFMDPAQLPSKGQKVFAIEGGETLLAYPLVIRAIRYTRRFAPAPHFYVHTNGTLLKPEAVRALREHGAEILISLDGDRAGNDRYRRFAGPARRSVWDAVMRRLKKLPAAELGVNMVVRPGNLDGLVAAMDTLSRMGVGFINLALDYYHDWSEDELRALAAFLEEFAEYYAGRTEREGRVPFRSGALHDAVKRAGCLKLGQPWWKHCCHLILGADGCFYTCESNGDFDWERVRPLHAINHARAGCGVDWAKRRAFMDEADAALGARGPDSEWTHMCPRLYYTRAKVSGKPVGPMIDTLHRTSRVLYAGLMRLAARLRENPSFRDEHIRSGCWQGS